MLGRLTIEALLLQGRERDMDEGGVVADGDIGLGKRGVFG